MGDVRMAINSRTQFDHGCDLAERFLGGGKMVEILPGGDCGGSGESLGAEGLSCGIRSDNAGFVDDWNQRLVLKERRCPWG